MAHVLHDTSCPTSSGYRRKRAPTLLQSSPIKRLRNDNIALAPVKDENQGRTSLEELTSDPVVPSLESSFPKLGVTFVENGKAESLGQAEFEKIKSAYPLLLGFYQDGWLLKLIFKPGELPPRPWPISVGGLPTWFTSDNTPNFAIHGARGRGPSILKNLRYDYFSTKISDTITDSIVSAIPDTKSLAFFGHHLRITVSVVKSDLAQLLSTLPGRIGNMLASYITTSSVDKALAKSRRKRIVGNRIDDSNYTPSLMPGIMVGSIFSYGNRVYRLGSTSGIAVRNPEGQIEILASAHMLQFHQQTSDVVWHPSDTGTKVGEVTKIDYVSDIAQIKLNPGLTYNNREYMDIVGRTAVLKFGSVRNYDSVAFDSPYSGPVLAQVLAPTVDVFRHGDGAVRRHESIICYIGNGASVLPNGVCGSTIVSINRNEEDFKAGLSETATEQIAVAQFHLYNEVESTIYCSYLSDLEDRGYNIPQSQCRN